MLRDTPDNRPDNGEFFICQNCGYSEHSDIVGAINIALRELVKDQDSNLKGLIVSQPDAHVKVDQALLL